MSAVIIGVLVWGFALVLLLPIAFMFVAYPCLLLYRLISSNDHI